MRTWEQRIWREWRARTITRAFRDVLLTARTYSHHGGPAWPSHATLAERAGCCVRSVQRALQAGRDLGLISWTERRVRSGWRWLRTSNAYRFHVPDGPVASTGQKAGGGENRQKKAGIEQQDQDAAARESARQQFLALGFAVPAGW